MEFYEIPWSLNGVFLCFGMRKITMENVVFRGNFSTWAKRVQFSMDTP